MIDSILQLLDRAALLLKTRLESRRHLYHDHVEPLFSEVLAVHTDYQKVFSETEALVHSPDFNIEQGRIWFADRRRELLPIRQKVTALAEALSDAQGIVSEARNFFEAVCLYFSVAAGNDRITFGGSPTSVLLQAFERANPENPKHQKELGWEIHSVRSNLDSQWANLLKTYAEARIKLLQ